MAFKTPKKHRSTAYFEELEITFLMRQTLHLPDIRAKSYDLFHGIYKMKKKCKRGISSTAVCVLIHWSIMELSKGHSSSTHSMLV